ncbi:hypothetical protein TeGR_g8409, partial [Tetraparma gracilis]
MLEYLRLMVMTRDDIGSKAVKDFDYSRAISSANEAAVLSSVIAAITAQLEKFPNDEAQDVALIADKGLFKTLSKNQRIAVRHRRNEKRLLKRTRAALEKEMVRRGLVGEGLKRAGGDVAGVALDG